MAEGKSKQELERKLQNALELKAYYQKWIERWEQTLSAAQKELSQPYLSKTRKSELEKRVKGCEEGIQDYKKLLLAREEEIKKLQDALGQLTSASQKPDSSSQKETQKSTSSDLRLDDATREKMFNQSMTWGHVEAIIIKVLIVGAAGVGKSLFLSRLLGVAISLIRNSTGVVEKAQRVNCQRLGTTDHLKNIVWEVVGPKELMKLLADAITSGIEKFTASVSPPRASRRSNNGSGSHSTSSADASYSTARTTVLQLIGRSKEGKLLKMTWIYLIDSGGQPQFHELLTAFIRNTTLGIFVFRLSDRLDDKPQIEYYKGGKSLGEPYPFPMSHKEIFQHCVQTISNLPSTSLLKDQAPTRPKILVLGTHRDEENKCSETRDQKEKILRDILHKGPNPDSIISEDLIYYGNRCIFPLNAKSPEEQDEEIIGDIRDKIVCLAPQPQSIPLQYYALELELEKKEESVISFKECLDIAKHSLLFEETAAKAAIHHLASLNLIQHFPECAEEVIFCDPNILLNKVNELIEKSYRLRGLTPTKLEADVGGDWIRFHMRGRVTLPMLKEFPEGFVKNLYDHRTLAKIFEDLLILTHFEHDDSFFMPALLDVKDLKLIQRPTKTCLIIAFSFGYAPLGLFSSSIAFLTSSNNRWPSPWMFLFEKGQLFRNVISFEVNAVKITLIDRSSHFEVHMELQEGMQEDPSMMPEVCRIVRQGIKEAIKQSMKKRHICSAPYSESFFCPCDSYATYHLASVKEVFGKYRRCCKVHIGKGGDLEEHHYQWLGIEPSTPSKAAPSPLGPPDHFETSRLLKALSNDELIELGTALGLSFSNLKRMTMLLGDMIQAWLNGDGDVATRSGLPSWTSLATALERTGHTAIASKVRKKKLGQVLTTPSPPRPTPADPSVNPLPDEVDSTLIKSRKRSRQTPSPPPKRHCKRNCNCLIL